MTNANTPNGPTFHDRKVERKADFEKHVKYWVLEDCTACAGTGKYDHDGNPDCGACDGTGKSWTKPNYEQGATDIESLIGKSVTVKLSDLTDLTLYFRKRRELIYQFKHYVDPTSAPRMRTRLHFGYDPKTSQLDWYFNDQFGHTYYLGQLLSEMRM